ncbi:MAG: transporter substrate-binding domain-containing protein [Planctomycetes bacterium]|nr:transporter substrate-binding domain-containing protein [Planctomycetota bacterium]
MKTSFVLLSLLALLALPSCRCLDSTALQEAGLDAIQKKGELVVGIKQNAPPFSFQNAEGEYTGFDVDIAIALAAQLELKLKLVPLESSSDRIPYIQENKVDLIIASMTITRGRDKVIDFSIPYFQDGQGLIFRKNSAAKGYKDLKGKKVGAVNGTTSLRNMSKVQPEAQVVIYSNYANGLEGLLKGEVDAFTSDYLMLLGLRNNHAQKDELEVKGSRFTVEPYGIGMKENSSELRDSVNKALMQIWSNETWSEINEKWFGEGKSYYNENYFEISLVR